MQRTVITLTLCAAALLASHTPASAQGHSQAAEIKKQMAAIQKIRVYLDEYRYRQS